MSHHIAFWLYLFLIPSIMFAQIADAPIEFAFVVRIPTYSGKIKFLNKQICNPELSSERKADIQNSLEKTIEKRNDYFNLIKNGFNTYFKICEVYYLPDTLYKGFLNGVSDVFINESKEIQSFNTKSKKLLYVIQGKDEYQLLLTDQNGNKLPKPWPYKKNTFLSSIKFLLNKESYLNNQIKYFDEKIAKLKLSTSQN